MRAAVRPRFFPSYRAPWGRGRTGLAAGERSVVGGWRSLVWGAVVAVRVGSVVAVRGDCVPGLHQHPARQLHRQITFGYRPGVDGARDELRFLAGAGGD